MRWVRRRRRNRWLRALRYVWALPTTCVGLIFVPLALLGGGVQIVAGALEIHGPALRWLLRYATIVPGGASAITLGHVVVGASRRVLERTRVHERVHVRQVERWGPFFIPAYLLASVWTRLRGGDPYFDNPFEREAYAVHE